MTQSIFVTEPSEEEIHAAAVAAVWLHRMKLVDAHWLANMLKRCMKLKAQP